MAFAKTEREWAERAARHLKAELKRADVTYEALAERLKAAWFRGNQGEHMKQACPNDLPAGIFIARWWAIGRTKYAGKNIWISFRRPREGELIAASLF